MLQLVCLGPRCPLSLQTAAALAAFSLDSPIKSMKALIDDTKLPESHTSLRDELEALDRSVSYNKLDRW